MPAVERLIKQTEPVPEVLRAVEQIREQAEPLSELLPVGTTVSSGPTATA